MNRKYSIGFLIGIILIVGLFVVAYRMSYSHARDKHEAEIQDKQVQGEVEICYYIKDNDGYVTVYEADQTTIYEYTTILVENLPDHVQEDLKDGIKVTSLGQVYGFLENYSS